MFPVEALIDSDSKVNTMQPSFTMKLGLSICKTNIDAQKIYDCRLESYEMVIVSFQIDNKDKKSYFFEETFLLANSSIDIAF